MSYEVKLEIFEGPLDLLLHLIHRNEVSITDIPLALIARQYLETVELMKSLNLDVAGEYLVMAAYLTHVKSLMLLPQGGDDPDEGQQHEDPRDELVSHLLEYTRYKEAAGNLAALPMLDSDVFSRDAVEHHESIPLSLQPVETDLTALLYALRDLIARTGRQDLLEIEPDRLSVKEKIHRILELLRRTESVTFLSLLEGDFSRLNLATTFLAVLEIVKLKAARVYQDRPLGTILISRRPDANGDAHEE
jgi:segregation and condensation protein A